MAGVFPVAELPVPANSSLKHGISSFLDDANTDQFPGADARLDISGKRGSRNPETPFVPAANALGAEPPTRQERMLFVACGPVARIRLTSSD